MFKEIPLLSGDQRLQKAWKGVQRLVQTTVEHVRVFNNQLAPMVKGDIVEFDGSGTRKVQLAVSHMDAAMDQPMGTGESGIGQYQGYIYTRFVPGLTMVEGGPCFLSATPGRATNVFPGPTATYWGVIADATEYSDANPYAYVIRNYCCRVQVILV